MPLGTYRCQQSSFHCYDVALATGQRPTITALRWLPGGNRGATGHSWCFLGAFWALENNICSASPPCYKNIVTAHIITKHHRLIFFFFLFSRFPPSHLCLPFLLPSRPQSCLSSLTHSEGSLFLLHLCFSFSRLNSVDRQRKGIDTGERERERDKVVHRRRRPEHPLFHPQTYLIPRAYCDGEKEKKISSFQLNGLLIIIDFFRSQLPPADRPLLSLLFGAAACCLHHGSHDPFFFFGASPQACLASLFLHYSSFSAQATATAFDSIISIFLIVVLLRRRGVLFNY